MILNKLIKLSKNIAQVKVELLKVLSGIILPLKIDMLSNEYVNF